MGIVQNITIQEQILQKISLDIFFLVQLFNKLFYRENKKGRKNEFAG